MKKIIKQEIIEAFCDICGNNCMKPLHLPTNIGDSDDDVTKEFEGMDLEAAWGYSSNKDGEIWVACICEECVDKHLVKLINFNKVTYL